MIICTYLPKTSHVCAYMHKMLTACVTKKLVLLAYKDEVQFLKTAEQVTFPHMTAHTWMLGYPKAFVSYINA